MLRTNINKFNQHDLPRSAPIRPAVKANYTRAIWLVLLPCDALMLALAFGLAYWLRFYGGVTLAPEVAPEVYKYLMLALIAIPVWLALFWAMHLYDYHFLLGGTGEYARTLNACTSGMMALVVLSFLEPDIQIARAWLVQSWLLSALLVCVGRFGLRRVAYRLRRRGHFVAPAIIVGTNQEALALAQQLRDSYGSGLDVVGFISEDPAETPAAQRRQVYGLPLLGTLDALAETIQTWRIEEVIIATTALSRDQLVATSEMLTANPSVEMRLSSGLYEVFTTGMQVTTKNSVPLMTINRVRLDRLELAIKTVVDSALIVLCLPILAPLFLAFALLIRLDSPGPIFHRRRVLGIGGKEFDAFKFRTMVVNGDEVLARHPELQAELARNHKLKDDPRITRVGKWLRRTSLDELPQLINVLIGQMSLVGPRMISPEEGAKYGVMQRNLLTVKPGMTGLWQVSGRSDLSYEDRVQLDMHYIRNYSIWTDLHILFFQTIPAVLAKRGAY
jgi:exopolysaccharide biosynthesis polyprenyl glycosylphosphotransferase